MKRTTLSILLFILLLTPVVSQRRLTLKECYDSMAVNTPVASEKEYISRISSIKERNLGIAYLPSVDLNGSYLYNSDVVDMSQMLGGLSSMIPSVAIPEIPHEQYRATVDVNQLIWDGGVTRNARQAEQIALELNMQQNEADIYKLREQVNNYFFSILLTEKQIEVTKLVLSAVESRIATARSAVDNGVSLKINLDVLIAEKLKTEQTITDLSLKYDALLSVLSMLTGSGNPDGVTLALPQIVIAYDTTISNPEMKLFDLRARQLEAGKEILQAQRMPKAFGMASVGYGNPPGNNFLSGEADSYYSFGIGIKWNIFDWHKNKNERESLSLQQLQIESRHTAAEDALQRALRLKKAEIQSLQQTAATDEQLIKIRTDISAAATSQLENGTITATEYLTELNAEKQARINAEIHRISLARSCVDYMNITGKEIE